MDIRTIVEAVRHDKTIAVVGTVAAIVLSFLAFAKIDVGKVPPFERRSGPDYESTVRLFITQPGFPWGRSALKYTSEGGGPPVLEGDPDRFSTLAVLYANIANSGTILRKVSLDGKNLIDLAGARVTANAVTASAFSSQPLPLIDIVASYPSEHGAETLARRTTESLVSFVTAGQRSSRIPKDERVMVQVIDGPENPRAVGGGAPTLPILVFLTIMTLTLTTIVVRRNLSLAGSRTSPVSPVEMQPSVRQPHVVEPAPAPPTTDADSVTLGRRRPMRPPGERLGHPGWAEGRAAGEDRH